MPAIAASNIILLVGLPGVGKTTLANALSARLRGQILSRDLLRDAIFPRIYLDYSHEQNQVATDTLLEVLGYLLRRHHPPCLIIDGKPFSRSHEVRSVLTLAARHGAAVHVVHCDAPLDTIRQRLAAGLVDAVNRRAERTPQKAERIHGEFEPLDVPHLKIDMTLPLDAVVGPGGRLYRFHLTSRRSRHLKLLSRGLATHPGMAPNARSPAGKAPAAAFRAG